MRRLLICSVVIGTMVVLSSPLADANGQSACGKNAACTAPEISSVAASAIGESRVTIAVTINPNDAKSTYHIWFEYDACENSGAECVKLHSVVVHTGHVGAARAVTKSTKVGGLTPGCGYTVWVVAQNTAGTVESAPFEVETPKRSEREGPACRIDR